MINNKVLLGCTLFKLLLAILPPLNIAVASPTCQVGLAHGLICAFLASGNNVYSSAVG